MTTDTLLGMALVTLAGLGTGTIAWPIKRIERLKFEHYWFIGMLVGLVLVPWGVVLLAVREPWTIFTEVGWWPLLVSNLFALSWGIANVLYGLCVVRIGAALTGAILSGLGVMAGVTLPMVVKAQGRFEDAPNLNSTAGSIVMLGVAIMLVGVAFSALAGFGRDRAAKGADQPAASGSGSFAVGLIMAAVAGLLSCGIALSFVYGQDAIIRAVEPRARFGGEVTSNMAVWAVGLMGGALVNLVFPAWLMSKNRSWGELRASAKENMLAVAIGVQFVGSVALLGIGMRVMGPLGASVGFGIQQAMQILGNQLVGFASGEWRGVRGKPLNQMAIAIAVLLAAVAVLAVSNTSK
jgi:L-rhamnose-H+ transport protein